MMMRGVSKQSAPVTASVMLGNFRKDERTRSEFLSGWQTGTVAPSPRKRSD